MIKNQYAAGYAAGYEAGKKLSHTTLSFYICFIAGSVALLLKQQHGWAADDIRDLLEKMQDIWSSNELTPEDFNAYVEEVTGVSIATK